MSEITKEKEDLIESKDSENNTDKKSENRDFVIPILDLDIVTPYIDSSIEKHKRKKKIRNIILGSLGGLILLVYIAGVIYHCFCFGRLTTLNGFDVSLKNAENAQIIINPDINSYQLEVQFVNETHTIASGDGVFTIATQKPLKQLIMEQNPFLWFINIWSPNEITVEYVISVDEAALNTLVNSFDCSKPENMQKPDDAYVSMEGGEAHIVPDTIGSILDVDKAIGCIAEALNNMDEELIILDKDCYEKAKICEDSDTLTSKLENAKKYLGVDYIYNFNGYEIPVSKEAMAEMAHFDKGGNVVVDEAKVSRFVNEFAESHSTLHTDRKFVTHDNRLILVSGGYYGWVLNAEEEEPLLYEAMVNGEGFNRPFSCDIEAYTYGDLNDIGDSYIEIDLTDQHVYVIENKKIVFDTPCVSGNVSWGMSTPGGVYPLTYKERYATLKGATYETKVAYWMPFNGDIGMHDATWKTKFGEDYYMYDGSHGCINLPLDAAETIFPYVEKGSPVVCYWEDEITVLEENYVEED